MSVGAERVKEAKVQTLKGEFESLTMKETNNIDDFFMKLSGIATNIRVFEEVTTTKTASDNGFCPLSDAQENRGLLRCRLIRTSDNGTYRCVK